MNRDPIVEEVRAIRERLAAECDFDVHKIFERARAEQMQSHARIVQPPISRQEILTDSRHMLDVK